MGSTRLTTRSRGRSPIRRSRARRWTAAIGTTLSAAALCAVAAVGPAPAAEAQVEPGPPAACGDAPTTIAGTARPDQAKTYHLFPFDVPVGTARIEVGYTWDPIDGGVIDLGVWDASGPSGPDAFRSWAGSRQGRIDQGTAPLVIAPDRDERTVVADVIDPGTWHIELGYAAIDQPLSWRVELRCVPGPAAEPLTPDPVDPTTVVRDQPGWYAGDFHLHSYHSSPDGPDPDETVARAQAAGLDIIPVTEYVTPAHWDRLGAAQRAHPDVLLWPGREVITYFGHMIVLSETPSVVEHRVGYDGITIDDIIEPSVADGALVSIAHPTIFPPENFGSACRGCFNQMIDDMDLDAVSLIEVVTEGSVVELGDRLVANPFVRTAVERWEGLLQAGHRLTAVSGSDDKSGDGYGSTSTMVWAEQLSRAAVDEALRRGHAYVRGLGQDSPELEVTATAPDGSTGLFGDTLVTDTAELVWRVRGGEGQVLSVRRNGVEVERVPITGADVTHAVTADRVPDEGPLGTFWGAEVLDVTRFPGSEVPTVIANPVFLADRPAPEPTLPTFRAPGEVAAPPAAAPAEPEPASSSSAWPWLAAAVLVVVVVVVAGGAFVLRRRR